MHRLRFAGHVLDARSGRLWRDGAEVPLAPLAFRLLELFAGRPGVLFPRDELTAHLWPDAHVTANSLDQLVSRLRRILGRDAIATVAGRGLRFDLPVEVEVEATPEPPTSPPATTTLPHPFVGRRAELEALHRSVADGHRLVSLVGPGGAGKTTLARHWVDTASPGRHVFVDLVPEGTAEGLTAAVVRALGLPTGDGPADPTLALHQAGDLLLVLDNFEQLVAHAPDTVARWVAGAPGLRVLVTTRVVLGLRGERVIPVGPLSEADGIALYVGRAGGHGTDPTLGPLVAALDGLPLAIELAARRARLLSPSAMLARLNQRFALLVDGSEDRPARHRSMAAALWDSWEVLPPAERDGLVALTSFAGSFDLEAAQAVVGGDALDVLQALLDRSLLQAEPAAGRCVLLGAVAAFVRDHADPHTLRAAEVRHGRRFADPTSPADLPDRLVAAQRALDRGDHAVAAGAILAAWPELRSQGPVALAVTLLEGALALDRGDRARDLHAALGEALTALRPTEAPHHLERAAELGSGTDREVPIRLDLATAYQTVSAMDQAEAQLRVALALARARGARYHEGLALTRLGSVASRRGDRPAATALHREALALFRLLGDGPGVAVAATNLAIELDAAGRVDDAVSHYREAIALRRASGNRRGEATARGNLAVVLARAERYDEALPEQLAATDRARAVGDARLLGVQLANLGAVHVARGDPDAAEAALAEALAVARRCADPVREAHASLAVARLRRSQGAFAGARAAVDHALTLLAATDERRLLAAGRVELAALLAATHDPEAGRALDQAAALRASMDAASRATLDQLSAASPAE